MAVSGLPDLSGLIGIPFVDGGRDPATGLDCWGLFMEVQKRFGVDVPDFQVSCHSTPGIDDAFAEAIGRWRRIEKPTPGCGVALAIDPNFPDTVQHFGVYIGGGKFLHTLEKTGAILTSVHHEFWKNKVRGFYEWAG